MRDPTKKYRLTKIKLDEISLVDFGADTNAVVTIFKRGERPNSGNPAAINGAKTMTEQEQMAADMRTAADAVVALTKRATDAEAALATVNTKLTAAEARIVEFTKAAETGESTSDILLKSADPLVVAEIMKLRKANETATTALALMQETAEIKKVADRIATDFPGLPVKATEFAPILKRAAASLSADDMKEIDRVLKAASNALLDSGKSIGRGGLLQASDAQTAIEAKALEISKSEKVSLAKANALVLERNPELYTAYIAERGAAN